MKRILLAALLFAAAINSANASPIKDPNKLNALVVGESTSEQVLESLGQPVHEDHNPDGRFVYVYDLDLPDANDPKAPAMKGMVSILFGSDSKLIRFRIYKQDL